MYLTGVTRCVRPPHLHKSVFDERKDCERTSVRKCWPSMKHDWHVPSTVRGHEVPEASENLFLTD